MTEVPISNAPSGAQPRGLDREQRPMAAVDRTVYMIGATHLDPVWLWPWQEGYQEARATFRSALDRMNEYPDFVFTSDQVVLLAWIEESDPAMFEEIRHRVAEGRWVNAGGWWVEPDCNMPMGESFVRQGLIGQRYLQSRFGRPATVGMNVDPFGHNAMLPQILRGQGLTTYMFMRPGPHESDFSDTLFWWQAPDGSRVLAYRIPFEYCSPGGSIDGHLEKAIVALDSELDEVMVMFGVGNHGGGPTKANIDSIYRYDRMGSFGRLVMASPVDYFNQLDRRGDDFLSSLPVRHDDLQHHAPGCYSAHSGIKAWQKRAQFAVLAAERWAGITAVQAGVAYPRDDLDRAWKEVLFNQFHDVLPGSAIETAYEDARDQLGEATAIAKRITVRSHNIVARQIDIPFEADTQPVIVFNPHPWEVAETITFHYGGLRVGASVVDQSGTPVLNQTTQSQATTNDQSRGAVRFRAEVPALGYRLYRLTSGGSPRTETTLHATDHVLENDRVRVEIDSRTGWLSMLLDKESGIDVLAGVDGTTHTQICADPTDTWGHRVVSYAWPGMEMGVDRIYLRESGPLQARIRVERSWRDSTMAEEFVVDYDARRVRVDVTLDWRERAHLMKLRVPTNLEDPRGRYEIPFGHLERPVDGAEEPGQGWVDLSGSSNGVPAGLTVLATNKFGYDLSAGQYPSIGITVVRSPVYSWHDPRLLDEDGVYSYQDQGRQQFQYELVPHDGDWRDRDPIRRAATLGSPLRAMNEAAHAGTLPPQSSFVSDGGGGVMVTAIKGSEDATDSPGTADIIVRAVETRGEHTVSAIDLPLLGRTIAEPFSPYQLRTFRVPAHGTEAIQEIDLIEWPKTEPEDTKPDAG